MGTLNLTREQRHAVDVASDLGNIKNPTAISGPAGSGKTLVAAVTAERLASQGTLFEDAADERVYFVTYTNELVNYVSRQLPDIVGSETARVAVRTVHAYLKTFLKKNGFEKYRYVNNENNEGRRSFINRYLDRSKEELSLSGCLADAAFLDEEIGWLLGQGIRSLNRYLEVKRVGRRTRLSSDQRKQVFTIYKAYMASLADLSDSKQKVFDFDDIGNQVLNYCEHRECKPIAAHLVIDEVQDLPITWIKALHGTVSGKVVFTGDTNQSIYGRGFTWQEVTGKRVRPIRLTEDFRSTQQIYLAARSLMDFGIRSDAEMGRPAQKRRNGQKPRLIFCNGQQSQLNRIRETIGALRAGDSKCAIAIGSPRKSAALGQFKSWGVTVTTLHSLKGLEADHVILVDLDEEKLSFSNEFTQEDTNRHLLYVGMTRATTSLTMMSATDNPSSTLYELSSDLIEVDDSDNPKARQALAKRRSEEAVKARCNFEQLAKEKVESDESLEQATRDLEEVADSPSSSRHKDEYIVELERMLEEAKRRAAKADERFRRQEDELRVYRAREKSDKVARERSAADGGGRPSFVDDAKILILGLSSGVKRKDLPGIFNSVGLPRDAFEALTYDEVHSEKFDPRQLIGSIRYSDIFVSTTPHKAKGIGDFSSLAEYLESNKADLPKLTFFENEDGTLKAMSKTGLKIALTQSDLYAAKKGIDLG